MRMMMIFKKRAKGNPLFLLILLWVLSLCSFIYASDINLVDQLQKQKCVLSMELKTYSISETEPIVLYGVKVRKFFTPSFYWGECGYGAISGIRAGYLEGGLILGYQIPILENSLLDLRFFTGAGGGGSAPQGGGFIVNPTVGFGYFLGERFTFFTELGYLKFLNGKIESVTYAININYMFWDLQLR